MRNLFVIAFVFIGVSTVTDYLGLTRGGFYGVVAGIVILSFFGFCVYTSYLARGTQRRFVRGWRENHPVSE
jgi:hypothetical protein